jgi:hypothetical protein
MSPRCCGADSATPTPTGREAEALGRCESRCVHQFAVARRLARVGNEADLSRLSSGLQAHSLAYWPIAKHLLMLATSDDRYRRLVECVPVDTVEGLRTQVLGAFNRGAPAVLADVLAQVPAELLVTGVRVLESPPDSCLPVALEAVLGCLPDVSAADLPRVTTTTAALVVRAGPTALRDVITAIVARANELTHHPVSSVLSRFIGQVDPGQDMLSEFVSAYETLPEAARAAVLRKVAADPPNPALDHTLIRNAVRVDMPAGAAEDAATLLYRGWQDANLRAKLSWASWQDMFERDMLARWDSCQVRLLARLCADGSVPPDEVMATAFGPSKVARDRYTNVVRYLADRAPDTVLARLRTLDEDLGRGAVGTLCSVLKHMGDEVPDADRPTLVRLLERHLHLDDRRVWPTMMKLSGSRVELLRPIAEHLTAQADENRRRIAFDKVFKDLGPLAIAELATQLRALLPTSHPKDGARRARLEGTLSPYSADARDWVERQLADGTSRPEASAAAAAAVAALDDWSPGGLQETGLPWLTRLLNSPWPNAVRVVAEALLAAGVVPLSPEQTRSVLDRLGKSLAALDDTQVQAALLDLLVCTEHEDGLAADVVHGLTAVYRDATAAALADGAPPVAVDHLPALFGQYTRVVSAVAARHLPVPQLRDELEHIVLTVDTGRITNQARRSLASLLQSAIQRHPALLPSIEQLWPNASDANRFAIAEAFTTYDAGTPGVRSLALARRPDCPPDAADYVHDRFPH